MAANKSTHIFAEDMSDEMCADALQISQEAFQMTITKGKVYSAIADHIRKAFDKEHGRGWNCIVGRSFGAFVTHEIKTYIFYTTHGTCILLWRA